jgi:phage/plasmid-associated DNA primase
MTKVITPKEEHIEFFRANGFNAFPIKSRGKEADSRYDASRTKKNQPIEADENYGVTPLSEAGTLFLDLDDKERFREFAEETAKKYMVSETGQGWHIPLKNVSGHITKGRLFDFKISSDKPKIEIQSSDQYVVGIGSTIYHDKLEEMVTYKNIGTMEIQDANGKDIHELIDTLERKFNVATKKELGTGSTQYLRDNFKEGKPPSESQSNDYFHQASRVCLTEDKTIEEAEKAIREIYDKWNPRTQKRAWSNVLYKIKEVYGNPNKFIISKGRPKGNSSGIDRSQIALEILESRKLYSDKTTHDIFENKNGFLELLNDNLKSELFSQYPTLTKADNDDILFKLESGAKDIPETNLDLYVFKNGVLDKRVGTTIETDELADMGFSEYNYLEKTKENEPTEFMKILYDNTGEKYHKRINAGLRAVVSNRMDSRISIIYGDSGVGKSTPLDILCEVLGEQYATNVDLDTFLEDRATKSMVNGKRLLNINDIPETWKNFTAIKVITGERKLNIREFNKKGKVTPNKLKIWASGNYLPEIPTREKDPMYKRRLSVIHNTGEQKKEDDTFAEIIIKEEGEKIISWILNLSDEECEYEDPTTVKEEWEGIASPEAVYLKANYEPTSSESWITVMELIKKCLLFSGTEVGIEKMMKTMKSLGYVIKDNTVKNIKGKTNS